ncbi:MAG: response regulator [Desulfomonile tiedjei]|uniref:histidine kinase n=1 Tax=Desulfomonile tiedjei TaxID=2358 RepID=A0A9D6Z415_9BACT|nr:response regulator [Desulfomonile tiedjei]
MPAQIYQPKVLIADDSEILNNMLKDVFEEHGYEVCQAFDGFETKSVFLKDRPDVALVDVHMPKLDGLEVLRYMKEKAPRTIVIVMTGVGSQKMAVKAMKLGADDYLTKPFGMNEVVALSEKLLAGRKALEENVKLKNKVRRSEKYLAQLANIINEALITTDSRGRIQFVNRAASALWGYSTQELRNQDIHFLIRGEARTLLHRDLVKDTLRDGKTEGEFLFRKKDKNTFPGYLSTSLIKDNDRIRGMVMVVADLTRLSEIERRLKQSEKLASLGKVVEGVAHEVRNCLTSLGGFSQRLRKITLDNSTCAEYTRIILDDVARLEKMVKDIEEYVQFSKFHTYNFTKIELVEVIERARDRMMKKISPEAAHSVTFVLNAEQNIPRINADPEALEEVFYNLILNAYEAMPKGGRLKVSVQNLTSAVSVSFSDTGVGIRSEDLAEIFHPFVSSKTSGAGMGLSKVYLLVEEHGGTLNVTSQPNKGSVFEIFLPVDRLISGTPFWESVSKGRP